MGDPIILYSVQTFLAYYINKTFYSDIHYVWCTPYFDSNALARTEPKLPVTSNPRSIYNSLINDAYIKDDHYRRVNIERNIVGITEGAAAKLQERIISEDTYKQIKGLLKCVNENKNYNYFHPVIYVIPYYKVKKRVERVEYCMAALPLSPEYKIVNLHTKDFDLIDFDKEALI